MTSSKPIKNVIVLGATGSIGPAIVHALRSHPARFTVSVYTRVESKAELPSGITVYRGDYGVESLGKAFEGQDAIVSAVPTFSTLQQIRIIDVAISAGVRRFVPSEYGTDTSDPRAEEFLPPVADKKEVIKHLKTKEDSLSWSAFIVGGFFDWSLKYPGLLGINIPDRTVVILNQGVTRHELTNLNQIGKAIAASLTPEHYEETSNQYVFINSFTVTQNEIVAELEKATGEPFTRIQTDSKELAAKSLKEFHESMENNDFELLGGANYAKGSLGLIMCACVADHGGLSHYSEKGLWNERLGLPEENLSATVKRVVSQL